MLSKSCTSTSFPSISTVLVNPSTALFIISISLALKVLSKPLRLPLSIAV